jgi:sphinganine-1-phosphate aldolase
MYFVYTDWIGGLYGTPSFVGSRPGFASAGAWYAMTHVGRKQYIQNAKDLADTTKNVAAELRKIEGVVVLGNPQLCVLAIDTTDIDIYDVCQYLKEKKGWHMSSLHLPKCAHICITPANVANVSENLSKDVKEACDHLKKNGAKKKSDTAALYGATATFPKADMGDDLLRVLMKVMFS